MIYFFNDQLLNTSFSHNDICSEYEKGAICHRLVLVCGTSTCHMAVSRSKLFIPGVWGPFWSGKLLEFNNQCFDLKDFETYCCVLRVLLYKCKGCGWTQEQVEISCWNLLNLVTYSIWNFKSWFILHYYRPFETCILFWQNQNQSWRSFKCMVWIIKRLTSFLL